MNFQQLFYLQQQLSNNYHKNKTLSKDSLTSKKVLSLQACIGTLAAKTKCYHYWENSTSFQKSDIIRYYNECLSIILSIGIDSDFTDLNWSIKSTSYQLTEQFLDLYIDISDYLICSSEDQYYTLLEDFLNLGISLGFTVEELERNFNNFIISINTDKKLNILM